MHFVQSCSKRGGKAPAASRVVLQSHLLHRNPGSRLGFGALFQKMKLPTPKTPITQACQRLHIPGRNLSGFSIRALTIKTVIQHIWNSLRYRHITHPSYELHALECHRMNAITIPY